MDLDRAIEFLIKNQSQMDARFNAKFDRAEKRFVQAEKRMDRVERMVTQLARYGVSLRSDVRRTEKNLSEASEEIRKLTERHSETDDKLNALIDIVNQQTRGNGRQK